MTDLFVKEADSCEFDAVAIGEVMLRLDPGAGRIRSAKSFEVWEGGGEYNVIKALRTCFNLRTSVLTALVSNDVGRLIENLVRQGGVDVSAVRWVGFDGVGRTARNGLNFTERGFGVRGALGVADRGLSAASQMLPEDIDWDSFFGGRGARWLHTGGVYAGLGESTPLVLAKAMESAKQHGVVVSYDVNYRPSLWNARGGSDAAQVVNRRLLEYVDVLFANEEDFGAGLGVYAPEATQSDGLMTRAFIEDAVGRIVDLYPNLKVVATSLRTVRTATINDWGGCAWSRSEGMIDASLRSGLEVYDRVGGGDAFAAGVVYGLMALGSLSSAVEFGTAHGALSMTTGGDTSMASLEEVEELVQGRSPRARR